MLTRRQYFVPAYAAIWVVVIVTAVVALRDVTTPSVLQLDVPAPQRHAGTRP